VTAHVSRRPTFAAGSAAAVACALDFRIVSFACAAGTNWRDRTARAGGPVNIGA